MALMTASGGLSNGKLALATAGTADVLAGKTYYAGDKEIKTGTMTNQGAWSATIKPGASVTIPWGCHSGSGKVSAGENGKLLEFCVSINNQGSVRKTVDSNYMSNGRFNKQCNVRIIAFTWASDDHQNVNVTLSGVGQLISAYDNNLKYLRSVDVNYTVYSGWTITANASGYYSGASGYAVFLQ